MDSFTSENDAIPVAGEMAPGSSWKRRRRSGRNSPHRGGRRGRRGSFRGKRLSDRERASRILVTLCLLLGLAVAGFAGFVIGRKSQAKNSGDAVERVSEVAPTSDAEGKLDASFADLRAGNPKKALRGFQAVQSSQPGLYGIDFLVGYSAYFAGEPALARESFQTAIGKKELDDEADALLALIAVSKDGTGDGGAFIADPEASAESALRRYASRHPLDPRAYSLCAEMLRSRGSYRTAAELMGRALGRTEPRFDPRLLEAKITLTRLQSEPPKEVPALSSVTSLDGPGALAAGYAAMSNRRPVDAVLFLERASEFYPGPLFMELMKDQALDEFRADAEFSKFLKTH